MIVRLVKMTFQQERVEDFLELFEMRKGYIRQFPGCQYLELLQDGPVFFTYSHWDSPADLEAYRQSRLFQDTWTKTRQWFADKPEAWSLEREAMLD